MSHPLPTQLPAEESHGERSLLVLLSAELELALNGDGTLREMLQQCAESLVKNLDAALARIWALDEAENVLELQASAGLERRLNDRLGRVPLGDFKIGRIAQDRASRWTNDVGSDPHIADREWVLRQGLVAFVGHPLIVEDRLIGALSLFSRHRLTPTILDAVGAGANQIAAGMERKRSEERLQFTQFTIDHIGTAVLWSDAQARFFNVNDAACHLTGYTRQELLSLHVYDLDLSVTRGGWPRIWQDLQARRVLTMESRLRQKNGTEIPISLITNLLQGEGRECSCTFVQDIIERKATEFAQRQSEMRFRAIFNQTLEFVGLLSSEGTVLEVNQPALDFRGLTSADVAGLPLWETPWMDNSDETREQVRQAVVSAAGGDFVRQEVMLHDQHGAPRNFDFSVKPVRNDAGRVELLILEARDITDQKRLEERLRQAQKMEAFGKLAGGVAHDFNNLLTIILGYGDMLQDSLPRGDPLLESIEQINKAGQRAAGLTRQLLAFSRKQVLVPVVLDLNTLLADMQKMLLRLIGENVALAWLPAENLWRVRVDTGQMEQVIMNLAGNARDAMPLGGTLTMRASNVELDMAHVALHPDARAGEHVLLAVSDMGCGMDRATLAQIFEPFFSTKGEKGTGLGLATVYGIVKQSGGHITVDSAPGCGTTFKIYLPRDLEGVAVAKRKTGAAAGLRGTETVLLVEDDDVVRALARTILEQHGYKVLEACQGGEALSICERHQDAIHLLATDVVMPTMSGPELAEHLLPLRPNMKVLYLSGHMDDAIVRHGLLNSGAPFLQKPYAPAALAVKVREVLDGGDDRQTTSLA